MEYYIRYLRNVRKVSESSERHYTQALRTISKMLVEKGKICDSIYEVRDINELNVLKEYLYSEPDFISLDERGHRMYSAGLNNYFKFASGDGFSGVENDMRVMDIEISKRERNTIVVEYWKRSSIIKTQSIKAASYKCELDNEHTTFVAKSTGEQYMEAVSYTHLDALISRNDVTYKELFELSKEVSELRGNFLGFFREMVYEDMPFSNHDDVEKEFNEWLRATGKFA